MNIRQVIPRQGQISKDVDALGVLKSKIADLQIQEKEIRDRLIARGVGSYEGQLFRATIYQSDRETLDLVAVRRKLTARFIKAHTCVTEVITVRVLARNGDLEKSDRS